MIAIESLLFNYPDSEFSLRVGALEIARAEKLALIGPSGSGKSTLLNLLAGALVPAQGAISIDGVRIGDLSDTERRAFRIQNIGFIFQDFKLVEYLDVNDNILNPYRVSEALHLDEQARGRAVELAQAMGIGSRLSHYPAALSHGERQRVAICRALVGQPRFIFADEATGNLDPDNKARIMELIFDAADRVEATLIAVTHDYSLLSRFERVIDTTDFADD